MKFAINQISRQGQRAYNQDRLAYTYSKHALLLVVADGMGGHGHGEVAAQLAVRNLTNAFQHMSVISLADPAKFLSEHILQVHDMIESYMLGHHLPESPRTTIVAAVLQHDKLYCAHVGDSRLYHFRDGQLQFRTEDHSLVQFLHNQGQLSKRGMLTHPERHKIYNCLGGDQVPEITLAPVRDLHQGDTLLLCSDGLWSAISDAQIGETLHKGAISETLPQLFDQAESLAGKNCDNLSAIALQWDDHLDDALAISTMHMPFGASNLIMNPVSAHNTLDDKDLDIQPELMEDEVEWLIAEMQVAISKTQR